MSQPISPCEEKSSQVEHAVLLANEFVQRRRDAIASMTVLREQLRSQGAAMSTSDIVDALREMRSAD